MECKPTVQQLRSRTAQKRDRPIRLKRANKSYKEEITITDSEKESVGQTSEGVVAGELERSVIPSYLRARWSDSVSTITNRSSPCWSPRTVQQKTESILHNLGELKENLSQARMAQPADNSMAEILRMIMEMNTRDKQERDRREDERRLEDARREDERRAEDARREDERRSEEARRVERRELREQEAKEEAERREAKFLIALKEAQPVIPQTVHIGSTKLPKMKEGEGHS